MRTIVHDNKIEETLAIVTQLVIIGIEKCVDILLTNDDLELYDQEVINDDEHPINKASFYGNHYVVSFLMFKQLNWDIIKNMPLEPFANQTGLWDGFSECFKD